MSAFDALMAEVDQLLMQTFGTECQLIVRPGAEPVLIMVDLQQNLTAQQLGEKGRGGNGHRLSQVKLGTMNEDVVPADLNAARLVIEGVPYVLTEPVAESGDVEFLLLPEAAEGAGGNASSTFLPMR